jgi:hypothetical protein
VFVNHTHAFVSPLSPTPVSLVTVETLLSADVTDIRGFQIFGLVKVRCI